MYVPIGQSRIAVLSSPGRCSAPSPAGPIQAVVLQSFYNNLSINLSYTYEHKRHDDDDDDDDDDAGQQCLRAMHACIIPTHTHTHTQKTVVYVCVCGFFMMYPGVEVAPS